MQLIILGIALLICFITDIKSRKILNMVTVPSIIYGFVFNIITSGFNGFIFSGKGFLVGLSLLLIPFILGGMGAGDVKLMAAIGALMGTDFVFYSFIYTALIGGVIGLLLIIKNRGLIPLIKSSLFNFVFLRSNLGEIIILQDKKGSISFPYGVAIVLGTVSTFVWGGFK